MRSLQIVTPHEECIYNCPFCISKAHPYTSEFTNNYNNNFELWKNNLIKVLETNPDLGYVVITGTNEPMQSPECVYDIINIVRKHRPDISIEIQTRWYQENDLYKELNTTCYSISNKFFHLDVHHYEIHGRLPLYFSLVIQALLHPVTFYPFYYYQPF